VLAEISGWKSRRAFLTSHAPGSTSTVQVEPQKENPARKRLVIFWTTLTGAVGPYNERNEARRSQPMRMQIGNLQNFQLLQAVLHVVIFIALAEAVRVKV